jgi:hypothetical protein
MKYSDIEVGQTVLYSGYRRNHQKYNVANSSPAVVLAKGVEHKYMATEGGWNGREVRKTSQEGVLIRVLPYMHRGISANEPDLVTTEEREQTTLAAYLSPATPENVVRVESQQAELVAQVQASQAHSAEKKRIILAFAQAGYEVSIYGNKDDILFNRNDVERLLHAVQLREQP